MRKPICLHCGEKLTHFGRGYKYKVQKFNGGWIHVNCYYNWQHQKKLKPKFKRFKDNIPIYQLAKTIVHHTRIRKELTLL